MSSNTNSQSNRPTHAIHQVQGEGENSRWYRVGSGWLHGDQQGMNLKFDSFPLHGRIVLRAIQDKDGQPDQGGAA